MPPSSAPTAATPLPARSDSMVRVKALSKENQENRTVKLRAQFLSLSNPRLSREKRAH
jgi:hypothetical protein